MRKVATLIEDAAAAQASAVGALRRSPVDDEAAQGDEESSLRNLRLARAEAQKIQDEAAQRDQDRKRQESPTAATASACAGSANARRPSERPSTICATAPRNCPTRRSSPLPTINSTWS
jgi:hypothetical protein